MEITTVTRNATVVIRAIIAPRRFVSRDRYYYIAPPPDKKAQPRTFSEILFLALSALNAAREVKLIIAAMSSPAADKWGLNRVIARL